MLWLQLLAQIQKIHNRLGKTLEQDFKPEVSICHEKPSKPCHVSDAHVDGWLGSQVMPEREDGIW